jgi:hypothetical protein
MKLEMLALKWAVTEKFRDYLIGSKLQFLVLAPVIEQRLNLLNTHQFLIGMSF